MSIQSAKDYIRTQQVRWNRLVRFGHATRKVRSALVTEVVNVLQCNRKRAIGLLCGSIVYKDRKGRGKTYREEEIALARTLWRELGGPCAPYLREALPQALEDYREILRESGQDIRQDIADRVLRMSASTIARALRGQTCPNAVWSRSRNKRSGKNAIRALVPIESGEDRPAHEIPPGDIQVDSVALCGGDLSGDFFWVATSVDRRLQWVEARPSFNLCANNYLPAFAANLAAQPPPVNRLHADNGKEFLNAIIYFYFNKKWPKARFARSFPGHKNSNAHIEQKNGSVIREFLGDRRIDDPVLLPRLTRLLRDICDYNNYCRRSKMLISKRKRPDGKGYICRYDTPQTPAQRALADPTLDERTKARIRARQAAINSIRLHRLIIKRRDTLFRLQAAYEEKRKQCPLPHTTQPPSLPAAPIVASALRAAPPGTAPPGSAGPFSHHPSVTQ